MHHALNTNLFMKILLVQGHSSVCNIGYLDYLLVAAGVSWPYGTVDHYPVIIGLLC